MDKDIIRKALAEYAANRGLSYDGTKSIFLPTTERADRPADPGIECMASIVRRVKILMHQTKNDKAERLRALTYVKSRIDEWHEELTNDVSDLGSTLVRPKNATAPPAEDFDLGAGDEDFFPEQLSDEEIQNALFQYEKGPVP